MPPDRRGLARIDKPMDREVTAMAFSDNGILFAAASEDRTVHIGHNRKDAAVYDFRPTVFPGPHRDAVRALAFDGVAVLATGGADGTVKLWSLEKGRLAAATGREGR